MKTLNVSTFKHPNTFALVDDEDYEYLNQWKWYAREHSNRLYVIRREKDSEINWKARHLQLHRIIMKAKNGQIVDHIDRNPLNNQKNNLRFCTFAQNLANKKVQVNNTSGYRGVSWNKKSKIWQARVGLNGKEKLIKTSKCIKECVMAYDKFMVGKYKEFYTPQWTRKGSCREIAGMKILEKGE